MEYDSKELQMLETLFAVNFIKSRPSRFRKENLTVDVLSYKLACPKVSTCRVYFVTQIQLFKRAITQRIEFLSGDTRIALAIGKATTLLAYNMCV